jgi:hypothetical protein
VKDIHDLFEDKARVVSRQQIYELLRRGALTSVKIGKSRKIHIDSIERVVASGA